MQSIQLMFDSDAVFEIKPEGYTFVQEGFCIFGLMEFSQSVKKFEKQKEETSLTREKPIKIQKKGAYLLGGVFLKHFYTVFNWDKKQIEFGVNKESAKFASKQNSNIAFKRKGKENKSL